MTAVVLLHPFDPTGEIALETALRLQLGAVVAVGVGDESVEGALRSAMAVGADKAIRIDSSASQLDEAHVLAPLISDLAPSLVMTGARNGRIGVNPVGPALAQMSGLPHVGSVSAIGVDHGGKLVIERRREGMRDRLRCPIPAVVSIEWGPRLRYPTLPGRLRARRADVEVIRGAPPVSRLQELRLTGPKPRRKLAQRRAPAIDYVFEMLLGGSVGEGSGAPLEGDPAEIAATVLDACRPLLGGR